MSNVNNNDVNNFVNIDLENNKKKESSSLENFDSLINIINNKSEFEDADIGEIVIIDENSSKETQKVSQEASGLFKKFLGFLMLSKEEKNIIKDFKNEQKAFKKEFDALFSEFGKMKKYEKKQGNAIPTKDSVSKANLFISDQELKLKNLETIIQNLSSFKENINQISQNYFQYRNLSNQLAEMNSKYDKLNDRQELTKSFIGLETGIKEYKSKISKGSASFTNFENVQIKLGKIEKELRSSITKRPELAKNEEIQRILQAKELSPAAIKRLVKLSYPQMSSYVNRLMNQMEPMKKARLKHLDIQRKQIDKLSNEITKNNKFIAKLETKLENWNFLSVIIHGSKEKLVDKVNRVKQKTIELTEKQSHININPNELNWFQDRAKGKKAEIFIKEVNQSLEHAQFLNARKITIVLMRNIQSLITQINEVKNSDNHDHIKEQELEENLNELVIDLAKHSKESFNTYATIKDLKLELNIDAVDSLVAYLKQTFPKLNIHQFIKNIHQFDNENQSFDLNELIKTGFKEVSVKELEESPIENELEELDGDDLDKNYKDIFE